MGWWLDTEILEIFSMLNDSMILMRTQDFVTHLGFVPSCFTESELLRLEKTIRIIKSSHQLTTSSPLKHSPKCHIHRAPKCFQG